MAHRTNLTFQGFLHLPIMNIIKILLSYFYTYFSHSPKKHLEFTNMAKMMNSKGFKIVFNLKIRQISMLSPTKQVFMEYTTLLAKMVKNSATFPSSCVNYKLLCDVKVLQGEHICYLCWLQCIHSLSSFKVGMSMCVTMLQLLSIVKWNYIHVC